MELPTFLTSARRLFGGKRIRNPEKTALLTEKMPVQPESLPSAVAARYAVRRALGQGAFGIVYLAEDRRIGRLVAIKQLFRGHVSDPEIHERFMQEARIGAQIDHPNIINVFALEEDENSACIIMEYLGGGSLNSFMQKEKQIDVPTAARIALGVLSGLEAAHRLMVVHRDIKPQNILFGPQGEPKVADFGVAHLPIQAGGAQELEDHGGKVMGTPMYMAPEQFLRQPVDARTDLYAVGMIFAEMLAGTKLYRLLPGMTLDDIARVILHQEPDLSGLTRPEITPELRALIGRLLRKDPAERMASARDAAMALEAALPLELITTRPRDGRGGELTRVGGYGPLLSSPVAMLEDVLRLLLVDGVLSPAERRELDRRAERLGISPVQAQAIEEKIRQELSLPSMRSLKEFGAILEAFYSSNQEFRLNRQQRRYLEQKREELSIPQYECEHMEVQIRDRITYLRRMNQEAASPEDKDGDPDGGIPPPPR
jgi:serine/threonine protein kinase